MIKKYEFENMRVPFKLLLLPVLAVMMLGCDTLQHEYNSAQKNAQNLNKADAGANLESVRRVVATGYAPISVQPGQNQSQKMLNAMRASKLDAYRQLTSIVHGQYLFGSTQVQDMVVQNDQFNAAVGGVIRGAQVVKTYPVQDDLYATILELNMRDVHQAYLSTQE